MKNELLKLAIKAAMETLGANCVGYDQENDKWVHSMNYMMAHPECKSKFLTEKEKEQMIYDVMKVFMQHLKTPHSEHINS